MTNIKLVLLLGIIFFAFSCKEKTKKTTVIQEEVSIDFDKMAKELCACMQPLIDLNKKIQTSATAGDTETVSSMLKALEIQFAEGERCAEKLEEKYGTMSTPESDAKAKTALQRNCPEVAALINQEKEVQ